MAGDGRDAHRVPSPLEQTGGGFVPEIVEADIHRKARIRLPSRRKAHPLAGRPGSPRRPTEGLSHGIRGMFQTLSPSRRSRRDSRILTASRERETTRLSPFFVSTRVTVPFERSTSPHLILLISLRRMAVSNATRRRFSRTGDPVDRTRASVSSGE